MAQSAGENTLLTSAIPFDPTYYDLSNVPPGPVSFPDQLVAASAIRERLTRGANPAISLVSSTIANAGNYYVEIGVGLFAAIVLYAAWKWE